MSNSAIDLGRERDLLPLFQGRTEELQRCMADEGIDLVLLTNVDSIQGSQSSSSVPTPAARARTSARLAIAVS